MPTYLVHGFRWPRYAIRIHVITQDLEEAAPEWLMAPATSISMLNSFYTLYDFLPPSNPPPATYLLPKLSPESTTTSETITPSSSKPKTLTKRNKKGSIASLRSLGAGGRKQKPPLLNPKVTSPTNEHTTRANTTHSSSENNRQPSPSTQTSLSSLSQSQPPQKEPKFNDWSVVKLLEQYDPEDMQTVSQPYAYVADYMIEISLSASLSEEMLKYEADQKAEEAILNAHTANNNNNKNNNNNNNNNNDKHSRSGSVTTGMEDGMGTLSVREVRRRSRRLGWFEKLRDGLQKDSEIGWFVVVCGDEERVVDLGVEEESDWEKGSEEEEKPVKTPRSAGLRGFFSRKKDIQELEEGGSCPC